MVQVKLTSDERVLYAQAVWHEFKQKSGTRRDMSSAEFNLVYRWIDRQIPLPVVLRGIQDFSGQARRLEAMERSVEQSAAYWYQAMGGLP